MALGVIYSFIHSSVIDYSSFVRSLTHSLGTFSKDDDDGSENVAKKMNLRSFKLNGVYLNPLNMSNAGDFSCS